MPAGRGSWEVSVHQGRLKTNFKNYILNTSDPSLWWLKNEYSFFINFAESSVCFLPWPLFLSASSLHLFVFFSSLACPWLSCPLLPPAASAHLGLAPAKLMNGYMVLTNGGSHPCSSPSLSSRTLSRPAGEIIVNMDMEPSVRKMDTVVKLDAVSFSLPSCSVELISTV